jgi:DNA-binding protein HU-beta
MNNKEFITKLAKRCNVTIAEATTNVDALVNVMTDRLKENDQLNISGFGVLEVKMRKERLSVNPKTGQRFLVPPKVVPSFRPSNKLKEKFNEKG